MGSLDEAKHIGFICRLCSKLKRSVILIFGMRGRRMGLPNQINSYLPIQVTETDDLPKTICAACLDKIVQHHQMFERIQQVHKRFQMMRNENYRSHANTNTRRTDAVPENESAHSSRTLAVDATEPAVGPVQEPKVSTTTTQQGSAAGNTDRRAASASGLRNRQENMRTRNLPRTGAVRRRRRIFRVVKVVRRRVV